MRARTLNNRKYLDQSKEIGKKEPSKSIFVYVLLVPRNCSCGRGHTISRGAGGAVYSAYVSVGTTSSECSVLPFAVAVSSTPGLRRQCFQLGE
jgi:hypothetical protein